MPLLAPKVARYLLLRGFLLLLLPSPAPPALHKLLGNALNIGLIGFNIAERIGNQAPFVGGLLRQRIFCDIMRHETEEGVSCRFASANGLPPRVRSAKLG